MSQQSAGRSVMVEGRIVWTSGNLFGGKQKTDMNTKQPKRDAAGEIMTEYGFGLAVMKSTIAQQGNDPTQIWAAIHAEAMTLYPNGQIPPSFAMKYKDGDGVDDKGRPFSQREGYAQHLVFACTTSLPIKYFKWENGANIMVNEGIKCGDYVKVQLQVKAHPAVGTAKAGLYLNPQAVQFLGFGKEIINAPSGDQIFGLAAPTQYPGASQVPVAPNSGPLLPQPMTQVQPSYQPPVAQAAPPPPHFQVLPPAHQPPPGGMHINPMSSAGAAPPAMPGYPQQMAHPGPTAPPTAYPSNPGMPPMPGYPPQ